MPTYKLTYFNITGLAEPLRLLLSHVGADFEDVRIEFADWPKIKSTMPREQVPILEIDGVVYHQSKAIGRYLAKKYNLYGSDELQALLIDAAVDDMDDCRLFVARWYKEEDDTIKAKLANLAEEKNAYYMEKFQEQVKQNGGYFVGNKLSWADIQFTGISEMLTNIQNKNVLKGFPELIELCEKVRFEPKIKAYLDKRPKTVF